MWLFVSDRKKGLEKSNSATSETNREKHGWRQEMRLIELLNGAVRLYAPLYRLLAATAAVYDVVYM